MYMKLSGPPKQNRFKRSLRRTNKSKDGNEGLGTNLTLHWGLCCYMNSAGKYSGGGVGQRNRVFTPL
jgi:hypothetical protein